MKNNFIKSVIVLITLFSIQSLNSQIDAKKLNDNLKSFSKTTMLPGFSITILKNDSLAFQNTYGYSNKLTKKAYTTETIQPIGSISKTFIGFSIMKGIDLGYFTLETNINTILPFKIQNPNFPNATITIKDLVTHTSSLIDNETVYMSLYSLSEKPTMELSIFLKEYYTSEGKLYSKSNFGTFEPGKSYSYSNIASSLAAYLIELKSGMKFNEFTKKYIFDSLKMNNSHWFFDNSKSENYSNLYEINNTNVPYLKTMLNNDNSVKTYSCVTYPDGSLKTSTLDLTKYTLEMIKGFNGKSNLLSKESYKMLFQKQFSEANMPQNMDLKEPNRAVFWCYNKKGRLMHTGSDIGVTAFLSIDPATKISRIIMINAALDGEDNIKAVEDFKKIISEIEKFENQLK